MHIITNAKTGEVTQRELTAQESEQINAMRADWQKQLAKIELQNIDMASVRALREWLAAQPSAPQFIIDHEAAAQAARAKLK